jgi:hypothetical protein
VGVENRDYARWTDEERRRFLGSSLSSSGGRKVSGGLLAAVAISAGLVLLGQFPRGHPIVPAFHFNIGAGKVQPGSAPPIVGTRPATVTLTGPRVVRVGSFLTYHGPVPIGDEGPVRILESYKGKPWRTAAVADGGTGSYFARIAINRAGILRIRIVFNDGARAVQTLHVLSR